VFAHYLFNVADPDHVKRLEVLTVLFLRCSNVEGGLRFIFNCLFQYLLHFVVCWAWIAKGFNRFLRGRRGRSQNLRKDAFQRSSTVYSQFLFVWTIIVDVVRLKTENRQFEALRKDWEAAQRAEAMKLFNTKANIIVSVTQALNLKCSSFPL
jgi:hypothetical protein